MNSWFPNQIWNFSIFLWFSEQPHIPVPISRVNQIDAARLDVEMAAMLKEHLVKVISLMKVQR
uniref:Uncharacterized protein n=1 Tax=Nelumbo nucifera TaxID=4432 RepID=A0A822YW32_NELNU|nr:TPA_asm: hypothetical protein HUJ06_006219 [Nelumbo nucifera]